MRRTGKHSNLDTIIERTVQDTGVSRKVVRLVSESFMANLQDAVCEGQVRIKGFGLLASVLKIRPYFDINTRSMKTSVKPNILFFASPAFIKRAVQTWRDEIEETKRKKGISDAA
jgi:nucleoid DNA-binding protein